MMKTFTLLLLLVLGGLSFTAQAQRTKKGLSRHTLFLGASLGPTLQMRDFEDFDISDWQTYGLKSEDVNSAEGRVRVPLKGRARSGATYGFALLYHYALGKKLDASVTAPFTFSRNVFRMTLLPGFTYYFLRRTGLFYTDDAYRIGLSPAAGLDLFSIGFGKINQIEGYTSPVHISQGSFGEGSRLAVNAPGYTYRLGASFEYTVSSRMSLLAQAGYGKTRFAPFQVWVHDDEKASQQAGQQASQESDGISIDTRDAAIVSTDLSATPAAIRPRLSSEGLYATVAIGYKLWK